MFSKSCKYAIRAVLFLAANTSEEKKLGVEEISKQLDIPRHFLAKILQQLSKKKLVSSSKGPTGGFYLNEKNKKGHLLDVIESIDGPDVFNHCVLGLPECGFDNPCPFHDEINKYRKNILLLLNNEEIIETSKRVKKRGYKI